MQEDLISLENVRETSRIELLMSILPERVGSLLSLNNLRSDLDVAFETADSWIEILERLYFCYRIQPYGLPQLRAAKKERKLYLWDWSEIGNPSARFENLVASQLLKYCHYHEDVEGYRMELRFLRDSQKREIDFIVLKQGKPQFGVECKSGETSISDRIAYFAPRIPVPRFYQVHLGKRDYENPKLRARVLPFTTFAHELGV